MSTWFVFSTSACTRFFSIFFSSFLTFVHFNSIHGNVIIINFFFDQWNWLFPSTLVKSDLRWWFPVNPLLKIVMHSQRVNKKERGRKNYFEQKMQQKHIELQRDTNNIRLEDPISIKVRIFLRYMPRAVFHSSLSYTLSTFHAYAFVICSLSTVSIMCMCAHMWSPLTLPNPPHDE